MNMKLRTTSLMRRSVALVFLVLGLTLGVARSQTEHVLYSFCAQTGCADGANPFAGLILDRQGNLYGTTVLGGDHSGDGVVFKLSPRGKETVLYSFCSQGPPCNDGSFPNALILDQKGNLYGTTTQGGTGGNSTVCGGYGCGVVFRLTPKGKEAVLYGFCTHGGSKCADGALPDADLIFDQKGNLYGTTYGGGTYGSGVVFKLTR